MQGRLFDLALDPSGKIAAVKASSSLVLLRIETGQVAQVLNLEKAKTSAVLSALGMQSFTGLAWSNDGSEIYCTDHDGSVRVAQRLPNGLFRWVSPILLPEPEAKIRQFKSALVSASSSAPGGIAIDRAATKMYVTLSRNNTVAVIDLLTRKVVRQIPVGVAPFTIVLNDHYGYVSNWGGRAAIPGEMTADSSGSDVVVDPANGVPITGTVSVIDLASGQQVRQIAVGLHPSSMALSPDRSKLFVTNSNSDSVSVIDTGQNRVLKTISVKAAPRLPLGSTPTALAVAHDGSRLFITMGGLNAVDVIDVASGKQLGMIPVGWYPAAIQVASANKLIVANLKGIGSRAPDVGFPQFNFGAAAVDLEGGKGYNSHDDLGTVSIIPMPDASRLSLDTLAVARNTHLPDMLAAALPQQKDRVVPVPTAPGETSVFKHVVYIIKENRTYDSVFGDMPEGNGEPKLCLFPRKVSPNHHALAEQFVLFDNLYCNGALSAEGHMWTDQGITTDYTERSSGGWGRSYPFEGSDPLAFASTGFIWDEVIRKGMSFRDYGEFVDYPTRVESREGSPDAWRRNLFLDATTGSKTADVIAETHLHTLRPYLSPDFAGFDLSIPDVQRAKVFLKDFDEFEKKGEMPAFTLMLLGTDHNAGIRPGFPTPSAMIADNDLALGEVVERISKSQFWRNTVIFVVEDDPQSGLDHVDGHRTVGLVLSPYTRRHAVDSTFYNQTSMLRTMELILGLSPLTPFDLMSNPMTAAFQSTPDLTPYTALPNEVPLDQMNKSVAELHGKGRDFAIKSMKPEYLHDDEGDENEKNRILWYAQKGNTPYPSRYADKDNDDH
jgi:YVTN family beta-propeller protein